jgi:type III pantothenate kinase
VVDLGNTRLKWARLEPSGELASTRSCPVASFETSSSLLAEARPDTHWTIASVQPEACARLCDFLQQQGARVGRVLRSAADVPVAHRLDAPETTGVDRALGVYEVVEIVANTSAPPSGPGILVQCGTALVVERIDESGCWQGGAIAPGLTTLAAALNRNTAQLPLVPVDSQAPPPPWGAATEPAIAAGVFWTAVGAARELISRQADHFSRPCWIAWTGGDAPRIAPLVMTAGTEQSPNILPHLVLAGLARLCGPAVP